MHLKCILKSGFQATTGISVPIYENFHYCMIMSATQQPGQKGYEKISMHNYTKISADESVFHIF